MLTQTDAVKQAWAATDRTLDIIVTVDGKDYQATEINSLSYDAGAFTGDTLGIGSTYENSVTIEFSSVVEAFKQGLTVLPKVGILVNGKFEYTELGTFIVSEVNRDRNNNLTTIKALDQMCKLEGQYKPTVSAMASPLDVIADIANQGGVAVNTGELQHLPILPNIKKIERQTLRTAIGWVAQLYGGFAAFDRDGKLTIRTTATPDYTITPGEYQQGGLTKNEVAYKTGGIKVTVNTKKTDDSGQEVDDTTTLQAGETTGSQIELANDSMTSDLLTTVWTGIKDITYYPYTLNWFGNPNLEAGDWVTLTDTQGNQFNVPVNQYTMSFNGGLESTISATQSSSTAGGYAYTGSAGSIKNMIEALQVRHTASGNNVYPPSYQGQPKSPKKGDVWYKQNGNNVEVWIYQEEDGKLSWTRTPLDGEVKAELQAMGKKTDEDLTRVKNELSSEAESQWQSMKADTSKVANDLSATKASLATVNNDLSATKASLATVNNDLSATKASLEDTKKSLTEANSAIASDLSNVKKDLSDTKTDLANTKTSLTASLDDAKKDIATTTNDLTNVKSNLEDTKNSLSTTISDFQKKTGELSGSIDTANSKIEFNSNAISEVKKSANAIEADLIDTKGNVANVQAKADSLQTQILDNKNNISSVTQKADGLEQTVKKGSRNLIKTAMELKLENSDEKVGDYVVGLVNAGNGAWHEDDTQAPLSVSPPELNGQKLTVSFDVLTSDASQLNKMCVTVGLFDVQGNRRTELENVSFANHGIVAKQWTRFSTTFDIPPGWTSAGIVDHINNEIADHTGEQITATLGTFFYSVQFKNASSASYKIKCAQAEIGPNATAFSTPNSSISKLIQTSKELKSLISDNDGNISQLRQTASDLQTQIASSQGDISALEQTAGEIKQSVKDNQNNITSVSQKADSINASLANTQGNVASLQTTANGLTSRVSSTEGNISSLQQTASGLQSSVSDNKKDISSIRQTANSLQSQISSANGDISSLQQTASGLQSQVTDNKNNISTVRQTANSLSSQMQSANGNISQLKQTADGLEQTVEKGSRNLIKTAMDLRLENGDEKVGDYVVGLVNPGNGGWHEDDTQAPLSILPPNLDGQKLTVGFDVLVSNAGQLGNMYVNVGVFNGQGTRLLELTNVSFENKGVTAGKWTRISNTFDIPQDWVSTTIAGHDGSIITDHTGNQIEATLSGWYYSIQFKNKASIGYKVKCVQAEIGPNATAFAAPDSSISQLIKTSKELRNLISDNDGNISQLRQTANSIQTQVANNRGSISSLEQTASGLTSRVSSAEGNISSLQQTANGLTSEIKDAKGNISSLQQTASGITSRVSNAEGNISSLQQTANRLSATVGDENSGLVSDVNAIPGKITSAIVASQQAKVITTATDIHDMKTAGYYLLKGVLTNSPVTAWAFLRVITSDSGDRVYHRIWKDNGSTVYTEEWAGSWSGWATHINSDNLKSNVITAINQSTEGVSISGNKITLDGNVNVAPGFTLSADHIKVGTMSANRISGGALNFDNITVEGLTANAINSGSISGQNLNINLDNGVVEFTKGNLHSTDGGFNISIDTKSFYLDTGNGSKLWIDSNGFHLQESASQHLWMNKDGLHNYTDENKNGLWINDTTLKVLNSNGEGLVAQNGLLQFSTLPTWLNFGANSTLTAQAYGIIGPDKNLFGSSKNGLFVKGREGVVIGTNSYNGETYLGSLFNANSISGSGISLSDDMTKASLFFTKAPLILAGGPTWDDSNKMSTKAYISVGSDWSYSHSGADMIQVGEGTYTRGHNIIVSSRNTNIIGYDWINFKSFGRIALDAKCVHSYPTYNKTTSAGANVYVAPDGALVRSSSARKYKTDIQDADNDYGNKLIEFTPQKWIDKAEKKRYEEDPEKNKKPGYYYGLIADDLDAAGLDMLVNYGADGQVEGINYDRLAVALLPVIKSLKDQVAILKEQVKALAK